MLIFLRSQGAFINPDGVFDGRISRTDKHIWVLLDNTTLQSLLDDMSIEEELPILAIMIELLGGQPITHVVIETSDYNSTDSLVIDFVLAFAEKWHCVLYDLVDRVYSVQELQALQHRGLGFPKSVT